MPEKVEFIESYIKIGNGDYQWNDNHGELIRCKDCKHCDVLRTVKGWEIVGTKAYCEKTDCSHELDWFCADGEKKR